MGGTAKPSTIDQRLLVELEEEIAETERRISRLVRHILSEKPGRRTAPLVMGWILQIGSDGVPHFREFGTTAPARAAFDEVIREPFYTSGVDGSDNRFLLTVELPGMRREDVHMRAGTKIIRIDARREHRRYQLRVASPVRIDPKSADVSFAQGVLQAAFRTTEALPPKRRGSLHYGEFK
jgi:HSP20 family molecular chaperone IbpA